MRSQDIGDIAQCNRQLRVLKLRRRSIKIHQRARPSRTVSAPSIRTRAQSAPSHVTTRRGTGKQSERPKTAGGSTEVANKVPVLTPGRKRLSDAMQVAEEDIEMCISPVVSRPVTNIVNRSRRRKSSSFKIIDTEKPDGEKGTVVVRSEAKSNAPEPAPPPIAPQSPLASIPQKPAAFDTPSKRLRRDLSTISEHTEVNVTARSNLEEAETETLEETHTASKPIVPTIREIAHDTSDFEQTLVNTNIKLDEFRAIWREILRNEQEQISEDLQGDINATIGKIGLLQRSKFKQYRALIEKCKYGELDDGKPILPMDLTGYWDIVSIQLDQIESSFSGLSKIRENNWQKPQAPLSSSSKSKTVLKPKSKKKPLQASKGNNEAAQKRAQEAKARMRAAKMAMMEKMKAQQQQDADVENGENIAPKEAMV